VRGYFGIENITRRRNTHAVVTGVSRAIKERERLTQWLVIIAAALGLQLVLLLYVKPSVFSFFAGTPRTPTDRYPDGVSSPDAILSIPVELEDEAEKQPFRVVSDELGVQKPDGRTDQLAAPKRGGRSGTASDIGDMVGEASRTLPQGPESEPLQTLLRPLQITWPDTRRLEHCLGHPIDAQIQVEEEGRILGVEPEATDHPSDCVGAAVESAKQIVFAPGTINGKPAKMWTRIRIAFRSRN
jgi:hypothetical protein